MNKKVLWISRTAVAIALLIALQAVTRPLGQYVTGSVVNLMLIMSSVLFGMASGMTVAVISPIFAFLLGIGPPFPLLIPFIALGNLTITALWGFINRYKKGKPLTRYIIALVAGALCKFAVLYAGVVLVAVPFLLELNEAQTRNISAMFTFPQLVTAAIGGAVAAIILPLVRTGVKEG